MIARCIVCRTRRGQVGRFRAQRGQTLIGMMIGLLISLLTIVAMVAIYKSSISVATNASQTALRDGQVSAALLAAQIEMQQAGYGIDSSEAGVVAVSEDGREVLWRYRDGASPDSRCAGLRLVTDADGAGIAVIPAEAGSDRRGLYLLPGKPCASIEPAPTWGSATEERPRLLVSSSGFFAPIDMRGTELGDEDGGGSLEGLRFVRLAGGACLPYLQQTDAAELPQRSLRISLRNESAQEVFSACLPNVQESTGKGNE